jgi:excisionase family DNA binding protein
MKPEDLARLAAEVAEAPPAELPGLVGEFARLQALALARLTSPASAPAAADEMLTMPVVAERLGITEHQAREMGRRGDLPTVHMGERHVRVRASALAEWIEQRERRTLSRRRAS